MILRRFAVVESYLGFREFPGKGRFRRLGITSLGKNRSWGHRGCAHTTDSDLPVGAEAVIGQDYAENRKYHSDSTSNSIPIDLQGIACRSSDVERGISSVAQRNNRRAQHEDSRYAR